MSSSGFGCRIKGLPGFSAKTHHGLIYSAYGKASYHQIRSFTSFSLKRG
jgi:hypothetical protein